jgi:ATP-binding cassette subfamily C protein LapB
MTNPKYKKMYAEHWFFGPVLRNKALYYRVITASAFINVFALVSAFFIMIVYDRIVPNNAIDSLVALTIGVLVVVGFDFFMKSLRGIFTDKASAAIDQEVSDNLFDRLSRNEQLIGRPTGQMAAIVREFDTLKDFIGSMSFVALVDFPFIILFLFVLYSIGGPVAAIPAIIVIVVVIVGILVQPIIRKLSFNAAQDGQSKQSVLVEMLSGLETLKTLKGVNLLRDRWIDSVERQGSVGAKSKFWTQVTSNFSQTGQQLSQVGIVFYGVFLIAEGELSMGALVACVILSGRTLAPLGQITSLLGRFNHALTAYNNFGELMQEPVKEFERSSQLRLSKVDGAVTLTNASLTYPGQKEATLKNVNLRINAGEKVAVVGKIGSGKTSLLRLVSGLFDPSEGSIKIDNSDISHMHPDDLRQHVGVVLQFPLLFSGTLKENLLLGNPDATDDDIIKACKIAGVDKIASELPDGFDTVMLEGGQQLSGGQRQAICIARAFIGDPKIIIMDEPSSAMDSGSEQQLLQDLIVAVKDKTFILITHRGTLLDAIDRVVVVDSGRVTQDGPKDKILTRGNS